MLTAPPRPPEVDELATALIEEARRRQRKRRRVLALSVVVVAAAIGAAVSIAVGRNTGTVARSHPSRSPAPPIATRVHLERPGALAVGHDGIVYVADTGRNQILAQHPNGTLSVVAGTGKRGFSGDGGPAIHAELNEPLGMTFAAGGTLYFADSMNNRVRAISPDGTIRTVAGTGKDGWVESGTPAADADIGAPADVTFSPNHRLYVAVAGRSEILRLDPDRRLVRVTGVRRAAGVYGVGRPATRASADGPESLAFDGAGDLFVQGFNTKTLLMISPAGTMKLPAGIGSDYPTSGGLASLPGGRVVATNRTSILELSPHGARTLIDFRKLRIDGIRGFSAEGIATDRSGDLYVDTWPSGYANTNTVALVEIHPDRSTRVLWKSR